jgi:hypothetical protein
MEEIRDDLKKIIIRKKNTESIDAKLLDYENLCTRIKEAEERAAEERLGGDGSCQRGSRFTI